MNQDRASAEHPPDFDGTWGGSQNGVTAQVIIVGARVIGFFWRDDYLDMRDQNCSADGRCLSFDFNGGKATLTRDGARMASLVVSEGGHAVHLNLERD